MAFADGEPIKGQYMHPLITSETRNSDPWQRNYFQPPDLKPFVPRMYPLIDMRQDLSKAGNSPSEMLEQYGFGIVKHHSPFVEELGNAPVEDENHIEVYHREVQDLVKQTLGAKTVFVTTSVFRLGERAPTKMQLPTGVKSPGEKNPNLLGNDGDEKAEEASKGRHLIGQANLNRSAPIRIPHMDFTPLGARQAIRHQAQDIYDEAARSGIIAYEDQICNGQPFQADTKEANSIIDAQYNAGGKLGPRYAAYSIWRPLCKVVRDPITLSPDVEAGASGSSVFWPYDNKIPGPKELGGDYLKEYAMLGVREEKPAGSADDDSVPKFYYVSEQEPDEVLFIKLFDSAALGPRSEHAKAPFHASPEIGVVQDNHPRESIDIRVMVFW